MAKVSPYYSLNSSDQDVYHDHDNCPSDQQIPPHNCATGTNGYSRCSHCQRLGPVSGIEPV
jgi:hypothetical protein